MALSSIRIIRNPQAAPLDAPLTLSSEEQFDLVSLTFERHGEIRNLPPVDLQRIVAYRRAIRSAFYTDECDPTPNAAEFVVIEDLGS